MNDVRYPTLTLFEAVQAWRHLPVGALCSVHPGASGGALGGGGWLKDAIGCGGRFGRLKDVMKKDAQRE